MRSRRTKMWQLGAEPSQASIDQFNSQLEFYKQLLVDAFKKRTLAFANRESTRFKFLVVWKAKFESLVSAVYVKIYADKNPEAASLFGYYMSIVRMGTPLSAMDGSLVGSGPNGYPQKGDWSYAVNAPWRSSPTVHLFAPLENILTNNYVGKNVPFYVDNPNYYSGKSGQVSVSSTLKNYFIPWLIGGETMSFPPTLDWVKVKMQMDGVMPNILSAFDYVTSLFSMDFDGQNLVSVIGEARDYIADLTAKTMMAVQAQQNIDSIRDQAAQFLQSYDQNMLVSINIDDLLAQAEYDANNPPKPPVVPPVDAAIVSEPLPNVDPGIIAQSEIPVQASSKVPLIAAAAVGAYLLFRKG